MKFKDKVVAITGAGAGIGLATAIAFAREGAKLGLLGSVNTKAECFEQIDKMGIESILLQVEVSDEESSRSAIDGVAERFGRLDILVNCAGIVIPGSLETTSAEQMDKTLAVNVKGVFLMAKHAVKHMRSNGGGVVINVSSSVAMKGVKDRIAYTASKGAVTSMTRAMASEYMLDNIRFNCVCPGTIQTPSFDKRVSAFADKDKALQGFIDRQPMKRLGKPEEVAESILFAASENASFMNGAIISIDGGMTV